MLCSCVLPIDLHASSCAVLPMMVLQQRSKRPNGCEL
jgi:hypothetical protein